LHDEGLPRERMVVIYSLDSATTALVGPQAR
jgi:hypothetical protein